MYITVNHQKIHMHFSFCQKKSFSVFYRAPSHTLKVFVGKISNYFFSTSIKRVFCINSKKNISTIHRCCHKILFVSVNYFRICISRVSCGLVFLTTLYSTVLYNIGQFYMMMYSVIQCDTL